MTEPVTPSQSGDDTGPHNAALVARLKDAIETHGPIGFDRFMAQALFADDLGYYAGGRVDFGERGDFTTAPEISPLFGECLALQCLEVFDHLDGGTVLEVGAGSGRLAEQVTQTLARHDALPERYTIVETSPPLRRRQQAHLNNACPDWYDRFHWRATPPTESWRGVVLANEVVDCLPVKRFRLGGETVEELRVDIDGDRFTWSAQPAGPELTAQIRNRLADLPLELPAGYQSELPVGQAPWLQSVTGALVRGVVLLIDYGYPRHEYYHPQRTDGTLVCHYRHRGHADPFAHVGLQDLTAFVDFTTLAEQATDLDGIELAGYTTQGAFLLNSGIEALLAETGDDDRRRANRHAGVQRLLHPAEMGERFKAMAFAKHLPGLPTLRGFAPIDLSAKLDPRV